MKVFRLYISYLIFISEVWASGFSHVENVLCDLEMVVSSVHENQKTAPWYQEALRDMACEMATEYACFLGFDEDTIPVKPISALVYEPVKNPRSLIQGVMKNLEVKAGLGPGEFLVSVELSQAEVGNDKRAIYWGLLDTRKMRHGPSYRLGCQDDAAIDRLILRLSGPGGKRLDVKMPWEVQVQDLKLKHVKKILGEFFASFNSGRIMEVHRIREDGPHIEARPATPSGLYTISYTAPLPEKRRMAITDDHIDGGILSVHSFDNYWQASIESSAEGRGSISIGPNLVVNLGKSFDYQKDIPETLFKLTNPYEHSTFGVFQQYDWDRAEKGQPWDFGQTYIQKLFEALSYPEIKQRHDKVRSLLVPMRRSINEIMLFMQQARQEAELFASHTASANVTPRDDTHQYQISPRDKAEEKSEEIQWDDDEVMGQNPLNTAGSLPKAVTKKK